MDLPYHVPVVGLFVEGNLSCTTENSKEKNWSVDSYSLRNFPDYIV